MASSYKSLRCDCCAGALEYNKAKKVWVCKYCGNEVRREEAYDGLFTIKNVVRQTLLDLASGRLDGAVKNLTECEKIDARYVGTCIARLAVNFYTVITPGACAQGEVKSIFGRLKRDYAALQELDDGVSTEEEALYESFEGAGDAFGVLYLTFDSLGDTVHRDFVEQLLDCGTVYSRSLNDNLLNMFMKNGRTELADRVLGNVDNLDCKSALFRVLSGYEDGGAKRDHVKALAEKAGLQPDDRKQAEDYLKGSADSGETKRTVYCAMAAAGAPAAMDYVTEYVLTPAGEDEAAVREILTAVCTQHPNDQELYYLLERVLLQHSGTMAAAELETLAEQEIFIAMPGKYVSAMLTRTDLATDEKIRLLELCHCFRIDARTDDGVLSGYLCGGGPAEERLPLIEALLGYVKTISTASLERYVLTCSADGPAKPKVLGLLLGLDLNMSFFRDLLKKYMQRCPDSDEVRSEIVRMLSDSGLQVEPAVLVQMACRADDGSVEDTARMIEKAIQSGVRMPNDALSTYLEQCGRGKCYGILMGLLHTPGGRISAEALNNYVLYNRDDPAVKARNALVFAEQSGQPFGSTACQVTHLGQTVRCNLLQGYVLTTTDDDGTADQLVAAMFQARAKLNPQINAGGVTLPFKKYATENKSRLSPLTLRLCTENKVFSLFF